MFIPGSKVRSYVLMQKIGTGSFADVWKACDTNKTDYCAMKVLKKDKIKVQSKILELMKTEVKILKECNNENVVKLIEYFEENGFHCIVMEFCDGGDLCDFIDSKPNEKIPEEEAMSFFKQLLNGFKGLHEVNAIHRDFKLENVLMHKGILKIADLGFSKQTDTHMAKTTLGTRGYMAPEIMKFQNYDNKIDIWSLGVALYKMVFGQFPFDGLNPTELLEKMTHDELNFNVKGVKASEELKDLLRKMLIADPSKRIDWVALYNHQILNPKKSISSFLNKKELQKEHENLTVSKNKKFYEKRSAMESEKLKQTAQKTKKEDLTKAESNFKGQNLKETESIQIDKNSKKTEESDFKEKSKPNGASKHSQNHKESEKIPEPKLSSKSKKENSISKVSSSSKRDLEKKSKTNSGQKKGDNCSDNDSESLEEKKSADQEIMKETFSEIYFIESPKFKEESKQSVVSPSLLDPALFPNSEENIDYLNDLVQRKEKLIKKLESNYRCLIFVIELHVNVFDPENANNLEINLLLLKKAEIMASRLLNHMNSKENFLKLEVKADIFKDFTQRNEYSIILDLITEKKNMYEDYLSSYSQEYIDFLGEKVKSALFPSYTNEDEFWEINNLMKELLMERFFDRREISKEKNEFIYYRKVLDLINYKIALEILPEEKLETYTQEIELKSREECIHDLEMTIFEI